MSFEMKLFPTLLLALALAVAPAAAQTDEESETGETGQSDTYEQGEVEDAASRFFGETSADLAKVIERTFEDHGNPNAYIMGEEAGGALVVGARYGKGQFVSKTMGERQLYWQGPSVGFDIGGNASKVFALVYYLPSVDRIYQRFPGVDGSFYFIGGFGVNYVRSEGIVIAPIRTGAGLRIGANVGYIHFTKESSWNPF